MDGVVSLPSQQPPIQTTPTQSTAAGADSPPDQVSQRASAARQRAAAGKWVRKGSSLPAHRQYWRVRKEFFEKYEKQLVLRRGDAAGFRDAPDQQTDTKFVKALKVARTTPYNPRSDGQAEGTNRVVEGMLRSFVDANAADWDLYATNVEFAIKQ
ncbi:hypothetical protein CYMTET_10464 [Cymbomonas tetramitiformis]|uniref:Integrase catalytic domain-containing protein n=1 Tax=Cymbomonas tetramitiformis TaxID=36881 RepID=A0AAE0GPD6_9CHLO|nr:hypothetical protein CYMTET_10464 [Cymbomonas tetramitiformis]